MKGINNTTTSNFREIMGKGKKFIIPKFQRDYSWTEEQWDDLWQDIEIATKEDDDHYMGYLVLQNAKNDKQNYIIDGQQRFTTITILILAAIKAIKKLVAKGIDVAGNEERIQTLMTLYIGNKDPVSLEYDNILHLNRNNNPYYREYIVKLGELSNRNLLNSVKLMKNCFEFYEKLFTDKFSKGESYAEYIGFIIDKLYFTVITVSDEMNAFKVFETLNARGVQLSSSDLLKNYLFSLIDAHSSHSGRIEDLEEKWGTLTKNIKEEKLSEFLRYYWNSKNKTIRKNSLFKEIRKSITTDTQVFEMLNEMISYSNIYMALQDYRDDYWCNDDELQKNIELLNIFGIKQAFPLLMAAYKKLSNDHFTKVLKHIIKISFRYNIICGKNPNDIEKIYNDMANYISANAVYDKNLLKDIYINDTEFTSAFTNKIFIESSRNTKIIKYILLEMEKNTSGKTMPITEPTLTIEHILPQNPNQDWNIEIEEAERFTYRIGNLCLLEKKLNKEVGSKAFDIKCKAFEQSYYDTTQKIAEDYDEWNIDCITTRQSKMAKIANSIWNISF